MDNNFPDGLRVFKPHEKAPDFVKANIEIEKAKLIEWLKGQPDTVKLQIKESKKGGYYAAINDYQGAKASDDLPF
jgi:hypothetical protein